MVKSRENETLVTDLKETFDNLQVYKMMLNPAKCVFGVPAGKLLGFLVSNRGIEANSEKIKAITSLAKPVCIIDVQHLAGHVAALSRFIRRLGEKVMPVAIRPQTVKSLCSSVIPRSVMLTHNT